jgi:hypothetical protein
MHTRQELLDMLKLEEAAVAARGFPASRQAPHHHLAPFRDSITCLNFGREVPPEPCDQCWLMNFVPVGYDPNVIPCHQIPLNPAGETVISLKARGDWKRLEQSVLVWLRGEIAKRSSSESTESIG